MENENLSPEEVKKKAYSIALRLKNSGLDAEIIFARLEKQGIPVDLARDVVKNVMIERKKDKIKEIEPLYNVALIRIGIGVGAAIIVYLITSNIVLPFGLLAVGILSAMWYKKRMDE